MECFVGVGLSFISLGPWAARLDYFFTRIVGLLLMELFYVPAFDERN